MNLMVGFVGICLVAACNSSEGEGGAMQDREQVVRKSWGSGRWFPGRPDQLKSMVEDYMDAADLPPVEGRVVSAIAPHAGYIYSGKVAAYTFKALAADAKAGHQPETVVILGFSHRGSFGGVAFMDGDVLRTPLGDARIDSEALSLLTAHGKRLVADYRPHQGEHSAENEVPFVQAALPDVPIVVGIIGDHSEATIKELVSALAALAAKKRIVVVASTDLLHSPDYELVTRTDKATLKTIEAMDVEGLQKSWGYGNQVCCGIGPVVAAMRFAREQGCNSGTVLYYRNSGDDYPESRGNWVVGYGAVVFAAEASE